MHVAPLRAGEQVDVVVSLKLRNKAGLDALTASLMAGTPGIRPLSHAEFMGRHAPTAAQAQAVAAYLRAQGFTNIDIASNSLLVNATGTAGAIRSAFKADLHEYDVDGRRAYANVTDAMVPGHLASTSPSFEIAAGPAGQPNGPFHGPAETPVISYRMAG